MLCDGTSLHHLQHCHQPGLLVGQNVSPSDRQTGAGREEGAGGGAGAGREDGGQAAGPDTVALPGSNHIHSQPGKTTNHEY